MSDHGRLVPPHGSGGGAILERQVTCLHRRRPPKNLAPLNGVDVWGGCLYCDAEQGEKHRPDCPRLASRG